MFADKYPNIFSRQMATIVYLYNNQINARALSGQSAVGYCAGKPTENGPFPSSLVPLFQSECKCETIVMKMTLICMKMKLNAELIFIWKVSHLDSFWNRGTTELGNGLFARLLNYYTCIKAIDHKFVWLWADKPLGMLVEHWKNSSRVLPTSRVVYKLRTHRNLWSIA